MYTIEMEHLGKKTMDQFTHKEETLDRFSQKETLDYEINQNNQNQNNQNQNNQNQNNQNQNNQNQNNSNQVLLFSFVW